MCRWYIILSFICVVTLLTRDTIRLIKKLVFGVWVVCWCKRKVGRGTCNQGVPVQLPPTSQLYVDSGIHVMSLMSGVCHKASVSVLIASIPTYELKTIGREISSLPCYTPLEVRHPLFYVLMCVNSLWFVAVGCISADVFLQQWAVWTESWSCWDCRPRVSCLCCAHGTWGQSHGFAFFFGSSVLGEFYITRCKFWASLLDLLPIPVRVIHCNCFCVLVYLLK